MSDSGEKNLAAALGDLQPKAQAHRLAEYLPDIDRKIHAGVTHADIVEALKENGFPDMTLSGFQKALYRWRKKHAVPGRAIPPSPPPQKTDLPAGKQADQRTTGQTPVVSETATVVESGFETESETERLKQALNPENRAALEDRYVGKPARVWVTNKPAGE